MIILYLDYSGNLEGDVFMDKHYTALGTSMLVLKLLEQQSMYGYQIIKELEQQSNHVFCLQEGTLYPILHSLEQKRAVVSMRKTAENGRERKYYEITAHGKKMLQEKIDEWEIYQHAVNQVIGGVQYDG